MFTNGYMNNTITIITPSLNQGQFIEQTINSVLSQEGDFFIDYIIADGGSTDGSVEIIKKYDELLKTKKYPVKCRGIEYRWWSKPDRGQSHAINQGFAIAKGDILAWINSDDYYMPDVFSLVARIYKKNPDTDLIYGDGCVVNESANKKKIATYSSVSLEKLLQGKCYIFQPSTFFSKKILNKVGPLDENLHYAMDYDLWIRIFKNGKTLYVPKTLSSFRIWEKSKSGSRQKKFLSDRKKIFKKYGGAVIDPESIQRIKKRMPFMNYINKKYPRLYGAFKKIFYIFINKINRLNKIS